MSRKNSFALVMLLSCAVTVSTSHATTDIDGWSNLKFGMSPEEARAAEPRLGGNLKPPEYGTYKIIESDDDIDLAGRHYSLEANFDVNYQYDVMRLQKIALTWESDPAETVYTKQCENIFQEHLNLFAEKYGDFDDLNVNNPLATDGVDKTKSQIKETVDGGASYYEKHFTMVGDFVFEALKTLPDEKTIRVLGLPTSQGEETTTCRVHITFYQDLPVYGSPLPDGSEAGETF